MPAHVQGLAWPGFMKKSMTLQLALVFFNTAMGDQTSVSGGTDNTAIGRDALRENTSASFNTAIGRSALELNKTGFDNTALGTEALRLNTIGDSNTAIGRSALTAIRVGNQNVAVGFEASKNYTDESNNIVIANDGVMDDSATTRIGLVQTSAFVAGIWGVTTEFRDSMLVMIDSAGQLGTINSSRRYKEDIEDMAAASDGLLSLRPVTFHYKKAFEDGDRPIQYGLIAEEVAEVFPDLVVHNEDGEPETVRYHLLATLLLNELQKQQREFQNLQQETASQAAQLVSLEQQNRAFESERERLVTLEAKLAELTALTAQLAQSATLDRQLELASN